MLHLNTLLYPDCDALRHTSTQRQRCCLGRANALHPRHADLDDSRPAGIGAELARVKLGKDRRLPHVPPPLTTPDNQRPFQLRLRVPRGRALQRTVRISEYEVLRHIARERVRRSPGDLAGNDFHKDRSPRTRGLLLNQEWIEHETWREILTRIVPQPFRPELCRQPLTDQVICWD